MNKVGKDHIPLLDKERGVLKTFKDIGVGMVYDVVETRDLTYSGAYNYVRGLEQRGYLVRVERTAKEKAVYQGTRDGPKRRTPNLYKITEDGTLALGADFVNSLGSFNGIPSSMETKEEFNSRVSSLPNSVFDLARVISQQPPNNHGNVKEESKNEQHAAVP